MAVGDSEGHSLAIRGTEQGPMPLTWGQGNMWDSMAALGPLSDRLNMSWPIASPADGVGVSEALARLRGLLSRLDIFRASFDTERVRQTFRDEVHIEVRVTEAPAEAVPVRHGYNTQKDPACAELASGAFGMDEPQIRLGLQHVGGIVTQIDVAMSHLAFDGGACRPLERLIRDAVAGARPGADDARPPRTADRAHPLQTADLVAHEQSADQVRRSDAVIDGWLAAAARLPPGRGLMSMTPEAFSVTILRSRAAAVAVEALALRHGVSASGVVVSALTTTVRRHVDRRLSAFLLVCNNRSHPQLTDFVGQTIGNGLLVLPDEKPGAGFAAYTRSLYARTITTYSRARYDCLKWRAALTELTAKGLATDFSYYFNDVRSDRGVWAGMASRLPEIKALREESSVTTVGRRDMGDATLFADLGSDGDELILQVACDDTRIAPADAASALAALEHLLVTEALET
ncbi:hypothetical protein ABZ896_02760 [Streptomyces sp. NPDC047072]|uniref:hypothetical protein n=1 Tax=Streptomyces sp. NPDC047072 TaxID=3154809 RepID=UPI0033C4E901